MAITLTGNVCGTCIKYNAVTGQCRNNSPVAVWNGDATSPTFLSGWAAVTGGDWCWQWSSGGPGETV